MNKFLLFSALLSLALAEGPSSGSGYASSSYENNAPMPYQYSYDVRDSYSGNDYDKKEQQDSNGNLQGQYSVQLPDGRRQTVTYTADHNTGFVADVQYQGNPVYPSAPAGGGYKASSPSKYS